VRDPEVAPDVSVLSAESQSDPQPLMSAITPTECKLGTGFDQGVTEFQLLGAQRPGDGPRFGYGSERTLSVALID